MIAGVVKGIAEALVQGFVLWWWNPLRQAMKHGEARIRLEHAEDRLNARHKAHEARARRLQLTAERLRDAERRKRKS